MKQILLALVAEIETLKAVQDSSIRLLGEKQGISIADAREAKNLALKANSEFFDNLRKQIEGLA